MVAPSRANSPAETGSSVEADLQPFREAIALHGEDVYTRLHATRATTQHNNTTYGLHGPSPHLHIAKHSTH